MTAQDKNSALGCWKAVKKATLSAHVLVQQHIAGQTSRHNTVSVVCPLGPVTKAILVTANRMQLHTHKIWEAADEHAT